MTAATRSATTGSGVAYDDCGAGDPTLVFLPGWCGPRTLFGPLADRLADRCRTLAVDWRGHGRSAPAAGDFGFPELVDDAMEVIDDAGAQQVVPVAAAHAGWAAIELRRRLGPGRVPRIVLLDWMVLGAPPPFLEALEAMMSPPSTRSVVEQITAMWVADLDIAELSAYVASRAAVEDDMWARGARAIAAEFDIHGSPVAAIAALDAPPATLHLYAQPADPAYLDAQREYAGAHEWFHVEHLDARSHFPVFEVPDVIAHRIGAFVEGAR
jgi:pimeloyl-ACP methyl ester carboxylesterase